MLAVDYVRAAQLQEREFGRKSDGFMGGQGGMSSTLNGWLPSVMMKAVVLDAVGDIHTRP